MACVTPRRRNIGQHLVVGWGGPGSCFNAFGGKFDRFHCRRITGVGPTTWSVLVSPWPGRRLVVEWWGESLRERWARTERLQRKRST